MTDDWDETVPGPRSPLVAVLAVCALMAVAGLAAPMVVKHAPLPTLVGGGAAIGLALWLVVLVAVTRKAGAAWIFGSLALMVAIGAAAGLSVNVREQGGVKRDMGTVAEMEFAAAGGISFPRGAAARGPLSKALVEAADADAAESKALADAAGKLGLGNLNSPYNLAKNPGVLGQCGAIAGLKAKAAEARARRQARFEQVVKIAGALGKPPEIVKAIGATMAPADDAAKLDALVKSQGEGFDAAEAQCNILARRTWSDNMGYFGWSSGADGAGWRAAQERKIKSAGDQGALEKAERARAQAAQEKVRDWLAKQ